MKRTGFVPPTLRATTIKAPVTKKRKCKNKGCRELFVPDRPFIAWCSPACALVIAFERIAKQKAAKAKAERADIKRRKQAIKTIPELKAELQTVFNAVMRLQDELAGHGCICCGKFPTAAALLQPGGAWDACHYRSRGSADHLRYNEDNVWRGLKDCNTWGHKDYRSGLIARIGLARVEALERDNTVIKWTRDGLIAMKAYYAAKLKELKAHA